MWAPNRGLPTPPLPPQPDYKCRASGHGDGSGFYFERDILEGVLWLEIVTHARGGNCEGLRRLLGGQQGGILGRVMAGHRPHKQRHPGLPPPPSTAQGTALSHTRHPLGHVSREWHLSRSVHFGVVNEMSCQTNGSGGSQSERMNCSLRKPGVLPFLPHEGQGVRRGRGAPPQHPHPHLCGPAAREAWGAGFQASYF